MLTLGILVGLALGVVTDYLLVRYGWQPALALMTVFFVIAFFRLEATDADPVHVVTMTLAYTSTKYLARPLIKRYRHTRLAGASR